MIVIDNTNIEANPGVVAIVIGVGHYPNAAAYKLESLTSAAASAYEFALWLLEEMKCPIKVDGKLIPGQVMDLKYLDLCISPAPLMDQAKRSAYKNKIQRLARNWDDRATCCDYNCLDAAVKNWQVACGKNEHDVAIFYFVGHGVESSGVTALLAEDFDAAQKTFGRSIDFRMLHSATANFLARDKYFFVDACRSTPIDIVGMQIPAGAPLLAPLVSQTHMGEAPIFFATKEGDSAWGLTNKASQFAQALLGSLRGAGVQRGKDHYQGQWVVTAGSLKTGTEAILSHQVKQNLATDQTLVMEDSGPVARPIHVFFPAERPPKVPLLIQWDLDRASLVSVDVISHAGIGLASGINSPPIIIDFDLPASAFQPANIHITARDSSPVVVAPDICSIFPPSLDCTLKFAP